MDTTLTPSINTGSIPKARQEIKKSRRGIALGLLVLFPLLLSFTVLMKQSLRLDESQSMWQSSHSPRMILQIIGQDVHVPMYGLILHFWQLFFGTGVAAARILSFVFFIATIPMVYFLGKKAYNSSIGLFAALLVAISPFMNWYANEIRMYTMFTFFTVANQYFFISLFRNHGLPNPKWYERSDVAWTGYAITAVLGMFSHYFFAFLLVSEAVFFLFNRKLFPPKSLRYFVTVAVLVAAGIAPWLLYVYHLGSASNTSPHLTAPTTINLFNTFSQFLFGFQDDHLNTIILSLWPLSVLLVFLAVAKQKRFSNVSGYFLLSVFIPIALAFAISVTYRPLFLTRYLIFTTPSLYLFLGWFFSLYSKRVAFAMRTILIVVMLLTLGWELVNASTPVKENYLQVSDYLNQNTSPDDVIAISAPFTIYPIQYYYKGPAQVTTIPYWNRLVIGAIPPFSEQSMATQVDQLKTDHGRIFVVLSYDQGYEEQIYQYFEHNFHRLDTKNFSPGLNVYVYQLRYDQATLPQAMSQQ